MRWKPLEAFGSKPMPRAEHVDQQTQSMIADASETTAKS